MGTFWYSQQFFQGKHCGWFIFQLARKLLKLNALKLMENNQTPLSRVFLFGYFFLGTASFITTFLSITQN